MVQKFNQHEFLYDKNTIRKLLICGKDLLSRISHVARLESEILLSVVLKCDRAYLFMSSDIFVESDDCQKYNELLNRRLSYEPISQILGNKEFYGFDFYVTSDVLTPRCDTETIIDCIKSVKKQSDSFKFADLGTGSGCIAITVLKLFNKSRAVMFEKSREAYNIARINISSNALYNRCLLLNKNWEYISGEFDVIMSNPPYIKYNEYQSLMLDVRLYEPKIALNAGVSGIECFISIFKVAYKVLKNFGFLILECGFRQFFEILRLGKKYGFKFFSGHKDFSGYFRCIIFRK